MENVIRLVHLSDIHFSIRASHHGFDPDADIRNEVVRDLRAQTAALGPVTAIIVSGDVAYAGKKAEYDNAAAWLEQVCAAGDCPAENVYVCPGNHDIDHDIIRANGLLQDAVDAVKRCESEEAAAQHLTRRLGEPESSNLFYAPLREFNEFAARYDCCFFPNGDSYAWDRDIPFPDGSVLRIRGLNSTLLSGPGDTAGSLFLGANAYTLNRHPGVEYLTICHHPPSWLRDSRTFEGMLCDRARIQLFGHEHDQRVAPSQDYIALFAGSINPHRSEPHWKPGYNIIEVSINGQGTSREMYVRVYARLWQNGQHCQFTNLIGRRGLHYSESTFELDPWDPPSPAVHPEKEMDETSSSGGDQVETPATTQPSMREITYEFFRLSVSRKAEIIGALGLINEGDSNLPDVQKYKLAIIRAKENNLLEQLHALING